MIGLGAFNLQPLPKERRPGLEHEHVDREAKWREVQHHEERLRDGLGEQQLKDQRVAQAEVTGTL